MNEIVVNLHMHTPFSDGFGTHSQIASAAMKTGIDAIIITDHNVLVKGAEGYYQEGEKKVLVIVGEEVHDQSRKPQKNHLLIFGADKELARFAENPQTLIDQVKGAGGLAFIAHPVDPEAPAVNQDDISWVDWDVTGFQGIELWNGFSEFKSLIKSKLNAIYYAYRPELIPHAPHPKALEKWDDLIANGKKVCAIGGSDAHSLPASLGPLKRTVFPYEYHFKCINTHLLLDKPLSGNFENDKKIIFEALKRGRAFVGNDLPAKTNGFMFSATGFNHKALMGEEISIEHGVTFKIRLPAEATCKLIHNGATRKTWHKQTSITYIANEPGAYRVEAYIPFKGKIRGWIFSNPIYAR